MLTVDRIDVRAPIDRIFDVAADVERWPEFLDHYRWVRTIDRTSNHAVVDMAAWRTFGAVKYPTWWVSEMQVRPQDRRVLYKHIRGITRGMDVEWKLEQRDTNVRITIVHEWAGPAWPLIRWPAANWVIGPVFIHHIAAKTLAGVKRRAEAV